MSQRCVKEVEELHQFFQDWFNGVLPASEQAFARVQAALAEDFEIVGPDGRHTQRAQLLPALRAARPAKARPSSQQALKIRVKKVHARKLGSDLWLVSYEEWHERGQERKGRTSTAILQVSATAPGGFLWQHVHETWLKD